MNKPVAWMREDGVIAFHAQKEVDSQDYKWQPLYIHPAKELTDSEITEVFDKCFPTNASSDVIPLVEFARAILRKATK